MTRTVSGILSSLLFRRRTTNPHTNGNTDTTSTRDPNAPDRNISGGITQGASSTSASNGKGKPQSHGKLIGAPNTAVVPVITPPATASPDAGSTALQEEATTPHGLNRLENTIGPLVVSTQDAGTPPTRSTGQSVSTGYIVEWLESLMGQPSGWSVLNQLTEDCSQALASVAAAAEQRDNDTVAHVDGPTNLCSKDTLMHMFGFCMECVRLFGVQNLDQRILVAATLVHRYLREKPLTSTAGDSGGASCAVLAGAVEWTEGAVEVAVLAVREAHTARDQYLYGGGERGEDADDKKDQQVDEAPFNPRNVFSTILQDVLNTIHERLCACEITQESLFNLLPPLPGTSSATQAQSQQQPLQSQPQHEANVHRLTVDAFEWTKVLGFGSFGRVAQVRKVSSGVQYAAKMMLKQSTVDFITESASRIQYSGDSGGNTTGNAKANANRPSAKQQQQQQQRRQHDEPETQRSSVAERMQNLTRDLVFLERDIMAAAQGHPFVVGLHFAFQTQNMICLVIDMCSNGHLKQVIQSRSQWVISKSVKANRSSFHRSIPQGNSSNNSGGGNGGGSHGGGSSGPRDGPSVGDGSGGHHDTEANTATTSSRRVDIAELAAKFYAVQIIAALDFLHTTLNVVHRDIKPENLLIGTDGYLMLADMGLATVDPSWVRGRRGRPSMVRRGSGDKERELNKAQVKDLHRCCLCGSRDYIAPEIWDLQTKRAQESRRSRGEETSVWYHEGDWCGRGVDHFALGVVLHELLCGTLPMYSGKDLANDPASYEIHKATYPWPDKLSTDSRDFVLALMEPDPELRLGSWRCGGLRGMLSHPFLRDTKLSALLAKDVEPPIVVGAKRRGSIANALFAGAHQHTEGGSKAASEPREPTTTRRWLSRSNAGQRGVDSHSFNAINDTFEQLETDKIKNGGLPHNAIIHWRTAPMEDAFQHFFRTFEYSSPHAACHVYEQNAFIGNQGRKREPSLSKRGLAGRGRSSSTQQQQ